MRSALVAILAFAAGILLMLIAVPSFNSNVKVNLPSNASASAASARDNAGNPGEETDDSSSTDNWPESAPSPEQVIYDQPRLMKSAIEHLRPRKPGQPNLYAISFAGDGEEDVFRNEAEYSSHLVDQRLAGAGHSLVLENNPATLQSQPLANWSNLETALDAMAKIMDPAQDILLLYITSHGSEDHSLLVDMDPLPLDQIGANDLGQILKKYPFKWKVVVVNACYSGGFVPEVRGPGTLVLTAAAADRSSFGCGNDSAATYFGRAWLVDGLNQSRDFIPAFHSANAEISQWEQRDRLEASHPQIDIGAGIAEHLQDWRKRLPDSAVVPYPAAAGSANPDAE